MYKWINMIIMVIQFPRVTLCFPWRCFNLQFHSFFSNFICPQCFNLFKITANSRYKSWWKLLMGVDQCFNMIIMVIQFPRVTLCFPWRCFNLQFHSCFSNFICPQCFNLFKVNCKFIVQKLVKAINGSRSMD